MAKIIILHGAPASGKTAIGNALHAETGLQFFPSFSVLNFVGALFEYGTVGYRQLAGRLRQITISTAIDYGHGIITTWAYSHPHVHDDFLDFLDRSKAAQIDVIYVFVDCSKEVRLNRVSSESRRMQGKISSRSSLEIFEVGKNYVPIPREGVLKIDSTKISPLINAERIVADFKL